MGLGLFAHAEEPDAGVKEAPASDGYHPRPSQQGKKPRDVHIVATDGGRVVHLDIEGTVDLGLAAYVRRALEKNPDAAAILLEVNTLGGRIDAAIQIRDALLASKVKTIAFIHPRAISAGALISLATDVIAVSRGGSIGAATPIQIEGDEVSAVGEKMVSYFRTEMRTTAEAKDRRGDVAEAMVDASVVIKGVDDSKDKLVTLDSDGALELGIADVKADSIDEVLKATGLSKQPRTSVVQNWAEKLVRFLTDPIVSGLLMSLGTLGILIELYAPGHVLPGAIGVLSLCLFFGGHLLVNLAGLEELILFGVGLSLLVAEVFFIPGFGVTGIVGIVCIFAALVLTLVGLPLDVTLSTGAYAEPLTRVLGSLLFTIVMMLVALRYLPRTKHGQKLVLGAASDKLAGFVAVPEPHKLLHVEGIAETDLRPVGVGRFGEERVDVMSEGSLIARGTRVRVIAVEGARVVVRVVEENKG
jgi:membrane-bound serine protease (ClpP class)